MPLAILHSRALAGIRATHVSVEIHLSGQIPSMRIVGLPDTEVKESCERVRAALLNANFRFPHQRITINLAPANLPKEGGRYDLPIALGILVASEQIKGDKINRYEFAGELALDGKLRSCGGALPMTIEATKINRVFIMPPKDAAVGALSNNRVLAAETLTEVCAFLNGQADLPAAEARPQPDDPADAVCLSDVKGQFQAKDALKVAAAGGHSVLMVGPPGSGKSMLAQRFVGLMPQMTEKESLASACVRSLSNLPFDPATWRHRPFRAPHHSISGAALIGGGNKPRPGEISLAHCGVLFLDELPEFDRRALEVLREPLESGSVTISRAAAQADFPAQFQLIAAMNPCPCGYHGHPKKACSCTPNQIARYLAKISGPLLDRIDIQIEAPAVDDKDLNAPDSSKTSEQIREETIAAREIQFRRQSRLNAHLNAAKVGKYCAPTEAGLAFLRQAMQALHLSARAYHRILKVARTIADLAQEDDITEKHIGAAVPYRRMNFNPK